MSYFPEDIPFMSEEERRFYGINIPKERKTDLSFVPTEEYADGRERDMTWGEIYKQFKKEYPKTEVSGYRPYVEGYLPWRRAGIIVWLKNGDVLAYLPKNADVEGSE